ncbi:MAG: hypothetical protein JNM27_18440 [Leptospirales bacterium]|nr:hypothetical protein [Leptospirales bacterium]
MPRIICSLFVVVALSCNPPPPSYKFDEPPLKEKGPFKMTVRIGEKVISVAFRGADFRIYGKTGDGPALLSDPDRDAIARMMDQIASDYSIEGKTAKGVLSLLRSWPPNLPLAMERDGARIRMIHPESKAAIELSLQDNATLGAVLTQEPRELPPEFAFTSSFPTAVGVQSVQPALHSTSLCDKQWKMHTGNYPIGKTFTHLVHDQQCFGRCGMGCAGIPNNAYTQACFNHDGCVDARGYLDFYCDIIFGAAVPDYTLAPGC